MTLVDGLRLSLAAKFLFFPVKMIEFYPSDLEIPHEEVRLKTDDGLNLHGWFFPGKKPDRTLLYLHGNAGNIGDRLDKIQFLRRLGANIFIFDYRGYGGSEGTPSIDGVLQDTDTAFRFLTQTKKIPNEQIILFGESLGGALAVDLAHRETLAGVILESTFTTLREMAGAVYAFVPSLMVPDALRSLQLIRHIRAPLLIIHGEKDEIVPFEMAERLFQAAPHPKRLYKVVEGHHNDVYLAGKLEYLKAIEKFLSETGLP